MCAKWLVSAVSAIITGMKETASNNKYTMDDLRSMSKDDVSHIVLAMQDQINELSNNFDRNLEQLRVEQVNRYGRRSEKLDVIDGQISLFDEAENEADVNMAEPTAEEVVRAYKRKKQKGKRETDLSAFPENEPVIHGITKEELDSFFGEGNWKEMPTETFKKLRYEPASWSVDVHQVEVYVGTGGLHQDEFLRGKRPKDVIENSICSESLGAAILNGKYVKSLPLNRISQEFDRNGLNLSRQTMSNWIIAFAKYFLPIWLCRKMHLLSLPVTQADETPVQLLRHKDPSRKMHYMWVHRSGEFFKDKPIVLYEYQESRNHIHPLDFYKNYNGVLMTDGLQQYHLVEQKVAGLTNANCFAHARRDFADACKAIGKSNSATLKSSVAHQALELIAAIYHEEEKLKDLSADERYFQRQNKVKPLVEAFFSWVREKVNSGSVLPKGKTAEGLNYCLNHEKQLKVFLTDGNIPIDNSASERAIRPFTVGRKNWLFIGSEKGAMPSALAYSIAETAKLNNLKPYEYFKHLLAEMPYRLDENGKIDPATLEDLMPWSTTLPEACYKRR